MAALVFAHGNSDFCDTPGATTYAVNRIDRGTTRTPPGCQRQPRWGEHKSTYQQFKASVSLFGSSSPKDLVSGCVNLASDTWLVLKKIESISAQFA